jgi:hypothetical protein
MQIKKSENSNAICGSCVHLNCIPAFAEVCSKMGIGPYHDICEKYQFNWKLIDLNNKEQFDLLDNISKLSTDQLLIVADLLRAEKLTRNRGFRFKEPVYVRLFGDNYLSNYAKGWVILAAKSYVYVQGTSSSYYGAFLRSSVIKEIKFIKLANQLILEKKINDPKMKDYTKIKHKVKNIGDIPTIDKLLSEEVAKMPKQSMSFSSNVYEE